MMDSIDKPLDADWWRDQTILATQLRDLVEGFDSVGSFAVPYARLPRRLGAYAEEFPRWADFASKTPQALILRPKLGGSAVRALIETALRRCGSTGRPSRPGRPAPARRWRAWSGNSTTSTGRSWLPMTGLSTPFHNG